MHRQIAYCSACDREVQIVVTDDAGHDAQANVHDAEVVCLEIGEHCTGGLCPIGATPPVVMAARLVSNGLQTSMESTASYDCARCGTKTRHVIIDHRWASCEECGETISLEAAKSAS